MLVISHSFARLSRTKVARGALCLTLGAASGICLAAEPAAVGPMTIKPATSLAQAVQEGGQIFARDTFGSKQTWIPQGSFSSRPMTCVACHTGGGIPEGVMPSGSHLPSLIGAAATFPKFNAARQEVMTLEQQIAHCVRGAIQGKAPAYDSPEMTDLVAYLTALSKGATVGQQLPAVTH